MHRCNCVHNQSLHLSVLKHRHFAHWRNKYPCASLPPPTCGGSGRRSHCTADNMDTRNNNSYEATPEDISDDDDDSYFGSRGNNDNEVSRANDGKEKHASSIAASAAAETNKRLTRELDSAMRLLNDQKATISGLLEGKARMKEDLEKVRDLLDASLVKVRELENRINHQAKVKEWKKWLQLYRSPKTRKFHSGADSGVHSLTDEEEMNEEDSTREIPVKLSSCEQQEVARRTQEDATVAKLKEQVLFLEEQWQAAEREWDEERSALLDELDRRRLDCDEHEAELQLLEAERVRLSILEDKVKEILRVLRNLRLLNFPRRTLGKILIESLVACRDQTRPESHVRNFLEVFYQNLLGCELLHTNSLLPLALQLGTTTAET